MKLVRGLVVLAVTWPAACGDTVTEPEIPNRTPVGVGTMSAGPVRRRGWSPANPSPWMCLPTLTTPTAIP